jgi:hypothetical protein
MTVMTELAAGAAPPGGVRASAGQGAGNDAEQDAALVLAAMIDAYRRRGYHQTAFPASELLVAVNPLERLEPALGALLNARHIVPAGNSMIALHPSARTALLSRSVLVRWLEAFAQEGPQLIGMYRDRIAGELATLVSWAADTAQIPHELIQRAAELAGVLATTGLDPGAFDLVGAHGGTPRSRLAALTPVPPRSLDLEGLRRRLRQAVSSQYPGAPGR